MSLFITFMVSYNIEKGHSKEMVDRLQVDLICKNIQFPFERFEEWVDWLKTQDLANQL
jgi:hypothetical protein